MSSVIDSMLSSLSSLGHRPTVWSPQSTKSEWWHSLEGFETGEKSRREDVLRGDAAFRIGLGMFYCDDPACAVPIVAGLHEADVADLIESLETPALDWRTGSLASLTNMRAVRQHVLQAVFDAFEAYQDDEVAVATVIKRTLHLTPEQLMRVSAKTIKNQFFTDLKRTGITSIPGPLVAFLHGEFEPTSRLFVIHWHLLATAAKGRALHRLKNLRGYEKTHTGAAPIRVDKVEDRIRQFSYLLKAFWGQHPIRDGVRQRRPDRIDEPYHTLYLAWLNRQQLRDIAIMNEVWSARKGGTGLMRQLYLSVFGRPRTFRSKP